MIYKIFWLAFEYRKGYLFSAKYNTLGLNNSTAYNTKSRKTKAAKCHGAGFSAWLHVTIVLRQLVFLDFQKAFDTVNHKILLSKLEHYGIRGMPLKLFQNYLMNRTQFVEINKKSSDVLPINYGVPQGSVLGPLLFLIYINDLNGAVTHSKVHHFADDTNMLYISNSLKDTNRKVNQDLRHIVEWLWANKILLNSGKTELILFRSKTTKNMNFRISGQKISFVKQNILDLDLTNI